MNLLQYCFYFTFFALWPRSMWNLNSPMRDQMLNPCIERQSFNWTTREVASLCNILILELFDSQGIHIYAYTLICIFIYSISFFMIVILGVQIFQRMYYFHFVHWRTPFQDSLLNRPQCGLVVLCGRVLWVLVLF